VFARGKLLVLCRSQAKINPFEIHQERIISMNLTKLQDSARQSDTFYHRESLLEYIAMDSENLI
jgi:hypothetical protein